MLHNTKKGPIFGPFYGIYPTLNSSGMQSIHVHMGEEVELWGEESFWKDDSACHTYIALITFAGFLRANTPPLIIREDDYSRSELGRTGMAPCWVQTKAETSTAFLCASRMVFPKSICATKVAVKLSPAPTVSATCTLGVGT